jgi:NhaP-type Na+/H+ or K+/H+ antiporter
VQVLAIVVGLLLTMTLATTALRRFDLPQPTVMVLVGAAVGFVPGLPDITLPAELVLLVFLPPLLYSHAWYIAWPEFSRNLPGIGSLAVVLLVATASSVAVVAWLAVPGMPWDVAFLLGAILCATDGIAASAIAHRVGLPRRLALLIEGEGLLNDAVAILLFKLKLAVVVAGQFQPLVTLRDGVVGAAGGLVVGLAVA